MKDLQVAACPRHASMMSDINEIDYITWAPSYIHVCVLCVCVCCVSYIHIEFTTLVEMLFELHDCGFLHHHVESPLSMDLS